MDYVEGAIDEKADSGDLDDLKDELEGRLEELEERVERIEELLKECPEIRSKLVAEEI